LWVYTEITNSALKYYKAITTQGNILVMNKSLFKDEQIKLHENEIKKLKQTIQAAKEREREREENITKRVEKLEKDNQKLLEYQKLKSKRKSKNIFIFSIILLLVLLVSCYAAILIWEKIGI
ncbi:MAG: hypothetical protein WBM44_01700, partial [Waterburya sp.]